MSESGRDPFLDEELPDALDGERLDRVVAMLTSCSRSQASAAVAGGSVQVDGRTMTRVSHRLAAGDRVTVQVDPARPAPAIDADEEVDFRVLHADADVIVIDKPPGLVVHPGPGHRGSTLVHGLLARFPDLDPRGGTVVGEPGRPGLVHRLDRGTSGLLVVARTPDAYRSLVSQLSTHAVERIYTALVWRHPDHPHGVIDAPIGRSRRDPLRMAVAVDGRPARTHYDTDTTYSDPIEAALVTCRLETGRTHQIRVHLASIGHPVIGDPRYGGVRQSLPVPRPFLHARELAFVHPGSGEVVTFRAPLPDDLAGILAVLA